jgi:hypothetical protein
VHFILTACNCCEGRFESGAFGWYAIGSCNPQYASAAQCE